MRVQIFTIIFTLMKRWYNKQYFKKRRQPKISPAREKKDSFLYFFFFRISQLLKMLFLFRSVRFIVPRPPLTPKYHVTNVGYINKDTLSLIVSELMLCVILMGINAARHHQLYVMNKSYLNKHVLEYYSNLKCLQ